MRVLFLLALIATSFIGQLSAEVPRVTCPAKEKGVNSCQPNPQNGRYSLYIVEERAFDEQYHHPYDTGKRLGIVFDTTTGKITEIKPIN